MLHTDYVRKVKNLDDGFGNSVRELKHWAGFRMCISNKICEQEYYAKLKTNNIQL